MTRSRCLNFVAIPLALLAALTLVGRAQAQVVKPFKVTGAGYADFVPFQLNDPARH